MKTFKRLIIILFGLASLLSTGIKTTSAEGFRGHSDGGHYNYGGHSGGGRYNYGGHSGGGHHNYNYPRARGDHFDHDRSGRYIIRPYSRPYIHRRGGYGYYTYPGYGNCYYVPYYDDFGYLYYRYYCENPYYR